jgi:hypothetical protein
MMNTGTASMQGARRTVSDPGKPPRSKVLAMNRVVDVLCNAKYGWRVEVGRNRSRQRPSAGFLHSATL